MSTYDPYNNFFSGQQKEDPREVKTMKTFPLDETVPESSSCQEWPETHYFSQQNDWTPKVSSMQQCFALPLAWQQLAGNEVHYKRMSRSQSAISSLTGISMASAPSSNERIGSLSGDDGARDNQSIHLVDVRSPVSEDKLNDEIADVVVEVDVLESQEISAAPRVWWITIWLYVHIKLSYPAPFGLCFEGVWLAQIVGS